MGSDSPSPPDGQVLVVDDNRDVLTALRLLLKEHVDAVHTATDPSSIPQLLHENDYDAILLDMNFRQDASSGREGFEWLDKIQEIDPRAVVVMITAYGDVDKAVRAMKAGAADFIVKPWTDPELVASVQAAIKLHQTRAAAEDTDDTEPAEQPDGVAAEPNEASGFEGIIGESEAIQEVFDLVRKVASTDANVLVLGENGTGKELIARAVHRRSERADEPFVTADLGALNQSLFESELFGHVEGAFTGAEADRAGRFETADGGTLFLDEIGNIPMELQKKLLTVLQRREVTRVGDVEARPVDIRLVCATNQPIYDAMNDGDFRQDLLFRINTVEIELPPLRERGDDVRLLARHFLDEYAEKYDAATTGFTDEAQAALHRYHWPGNVRELKHTIERAVILSESPQIGPDDLRFSAPSLEASTGDGEEAFDTLDLDDLEQKAVRKALSKHGGNVSQAANELGISRRALYRRIEKYGL
ncbi:sigma-54-dependent transcriptional regulator [Salinibacter ruber]|jgi:two-component system response regulator HydG|uniref:DNA-binding NtrC family response regulator n=2 Tax=Salinibacter ruber TaxID=146919 RepID=A0A9X2VC73_9BACT|nr:sigma-54 dependent transcriptional regulator [Salinibacter ruber]MBB4090029.1 DNA-binding NtrC family response regulator [Salinibacter ruber]MCS3611539.1 DNA-binding NtrC family response regulator [Salinibacter ruber]MCS3646712.1 DNA-binding NtrC family response regulator [Salinibacter ruber]MCS3675352.1 DNA-binding NtrC family response regulator [Salinibacter ruber]MCS3784455.1 DNA-binding NtrC family response regulator [Salinibacter ruber]